MIFSVLQNLNEALIKISGPNTIANRFVLGLGGDHQTILDVFHTFKASKINELNRYEMLSKFFERRFGIMLTY